MFFIFSSFLGGGEDGCVMLHHLDLDYFNRALPHIDHTHTHTHTPLWLQVEDEGEEEKQEEHTRSGAA